MHGSISMNTIVKKRQGNRLTQITSLPYIPKLKRKQKQRCKAISFKIKPARPTKLRLRAQKKYNLLTGKFFYLLLPFPVLVGILTPLIKGPSTEN